MLKVEPKEVIRLDQQLKYLLEIKVLLVEMVTPDPLARLRRKVQEVLILGQQPLGVTEEVKIGFRLVSCLAPLWINS